MTTRQKKAFEKVSEDPRKSVSKAMREVGYTKRSAEKPQQLTRSKGWAELMEEYMPDTLLATVNKQGLEAMKQISVRGGRDATAASDDFVEVEDHPTRHKFLETALKLKGRFVEKTELQGNIKFVIKRE